LTVSRFRSLIRSVGSLGMLPNEAWWRQKIVSEVKFPWVRRMRWATMSPTTDADPQEGRSLMDALGGRGGVQRLAGRWHYRMDPGTVLLLLSCESSCPGSFLWAGGCVADEGHCFVRLGLVTSSVYGCPGVPASWGPGDNPRTGGIDWTMGVAQVARVN